MWLRTPDELTGRPFWLIGMSALALSLAYGVFLGTMVIQSLWLQTQMGYTAQWAGFALAPVATTC